MTVTASASIPEKLFISQAREKTAGADDCLKLYEDWAKTYDQELSEESQNYVAPVLTTQAALNFELGKKPADTIVLDAGCGTGLVGKALALAGVKTIDGIDLSPPMLDIARETGAYRDLAEADMNKPINLEDDKYDIVSCVGTFTSGHVYPDPALRELVRVTRPQGIVVATILQKIWESGGYAAEVDKLAAEGLVTVASNELIDYVKARGDKAVLIILQKAESKRSEP